MKFSIVIPCYKVEKYLHECVDSVLNQTFQDYEVILVDDGSPDRVPEICDEYAEKNFRVRVVHHANAGLACARNSGISLAQGEYVICIDSDDYLLSPDVLSHINAKTEGQPDIVLFGYKKLFESDGAWGDDVVPPPVEGDAARVTMAQLQNNSFTATAWTKAVRLDFLRENNVEFTPKIICEDIDWYLKVMCHVRSINCLREPCIVYRQRSGSLSHAPTVKSLEDNLWILERWLKHCDAAAQMAEGMRPAMYGALAYFYGNLLILYAGFDKAVSAPFTKRVKALKRLLRYAVTPRAKMERRIISVVGVDIATKMLRVLLKYKKRQ